MDAISPALLPLTDQQWRLNNLYTIRDKWGTAVPFRMNWAQNDLFDGMHYLNIILKARQLGFSTFIQIYCLDQCIFFPNTSAGTIAHTLDDAEDIFANKCKFAYDQLPDAIKQMAVATQDSARQLSFSNGSSIRVSTSLRGGTYQLLHISEFGKISANRPDKAKEIRTGALNTVEQGNLIWVESTAEGAEGDFHDLVQDARKKQEQDTKLTPLDFKFFFYAWHENPDYTLADKVPITAEYREYFMELKAKGISLTDGQMAWYVKKAETQHEEMRREYPSTPDEAFEASVQGAYYATQMTKVRLDGRICKVPHTEGVVNTFWDLGLDDETTIWLHQRHRKEDRFIKYFHGSGEAAAYYGKWLTEWADKHGLKFGVHYLPHDANTRSLATKTAYRDELRQHLAGTFKVLPRTDDLYGDIQKTRTALGGCWFDEEECAEGIKTLDNYRREWDDNRGTFKSTPRHDWASHGADAFRQFAVGYKPVVQSGQPLPARRARV